MQIIEALRETLRKISAETHGQTQHVRTVQGRQMYFLNQNQMLLLLPHLQPEEGGNNDLQVMDSASPDFGKHYYLFGISPVDKSGYVIK